MTPQISVIVPIYNSDKYLRRCIDSILAQTYTNFELLLINDGSFDKSAAICDEYELRDSRVRVFHKENGGVSSARNLGVKEAKGEWIAFVDSDDWILETYIARYVSHISTESQILVATTMEKDVEPSDYIKGLLMNTIAWGMPFKLYSISCFRDNEHMLVPREINIGEDLIANLSIAKVVDRIQYVINDGYCLNNENMASVTRSRTFSLEYEMKFLQYVKQVLETETDYHTEVWLLVLRSIKNLITNGVKVPQGHLLYREMKLNMPSVMPPLGLGDKIVLYLQCPIVVRTILLLMAKWRIHLKE